MDIVTSVLAVIFIMAGTALGGYITYKSNKESNEKLESIEKLNNEIERTGNLNKELNFQIKKTGNLNIDLNNQILDISEKNKTLTQKTIELSELINNVQTGGNSYCIIDVLYFGDNEIRYMLRHKGDFNLKNVSVQIIDNVKQQELLQNLGLSGGGLKMDNNIESKLKEFINSSYYKENFEINSLKAGTGKYLKEFKLKNNQKMISLDITIYAENGIFREKIRHIDILGERVFASELRNNKNEVLEDSISKKFPKNEDGSIKWNYSN